jgi:hypothetical protein
VELGGNWQEQNGLFVNPTMPSLNPMVVPAPQPYYVLLRTAEQSKPLPLERTTATSEIIGYRGWQITVKGLESITQNFTWPFRRRAQAVCVHTPILETCECGLYAFSQPPLADKYANDDNEAWGEVSLWGKIVVCQEGYRAQYAYPRKIYVREGTMMPEMINALRNAYAVEFQTIKDKRERDDDDDLA